MRKIIRIDASRCDGCGRCVTACAEGAIELREGKAHLVSDRSCDGLGACLGECPRGALTIEEREAAPFDEAAVAEARHDGRPFVAQAGAAKTGTPEATPGACSALRNWPIQLRLAPAAGPPYREATLLLAADCVPSAVPDFHTRMLAGKTLLIGCPKLDDLPSAVAKLTDILSRNDLVGMEVAYMEVPCCLALARAAAAALEASGKQIPLTLRKVKISGESC